VIPAGLLDAQQAEATVSTVHTSAALGSMALQASLNQIDPTNFAPLSSPPLVNGTGDATSGTVNIDFGTGTMVNNATVAGEMVASYTVTGGTSVSITVTFSNLTTMTSAAGTATIGGSLTLSGTLNSSSNITGTISGSLTAMASGNSTTVTPTLTYAIDGTPSTGDITVDGTVGIDSSLYGEWTATLTAIHALISQATRVIDTGTAALERSGFPSVTVTMMFTGANAGSLEVDPSGYTKNFTL
jgi:hypothetical protein